MPDLDALGVESHPVGTITMWSGLLSNIPSGWLLCDGTFGTPDLVQFFARGSPPATEPLTELGGDQHTITGAEMPPHTHTTTGLGHRHRQHVNDTDPSAGGSTGFAGNTGGAPYNFQNENAGGNIGNVGNNSPHENKPPFFELAFIQRST